MSHLPDWARQSWGPGDFNRLYRKGKLPYEEKVHGQVRGPFGLFQEDGALSREFVLIHLPTGKGMGKGPWNRMISFVQNIATYTDWDKTVEFKRDSELFDRVRWQAQLLQIEDL